MIPAKAFSVQHSVSLFIGCWLIAERYCQKLWMTGAKTRRILGAMKVPSSNKERDTPHATEYDNE
ncbi:MAG: hypothetical protein SVV80_10160, partial [Planctomycetota bacterium]|nr:hypothetical protein [Planctomycetota bacterium]